MNANPKALQSYGKIANGEKDPIRQIVMLYDGAIKFLNLTAEDIEQQRHYLEGRAFNACPRYHQLSTVDTRLRQRR